MKTQLRNIVGAGILGFSALVSGCNHMTKVKSQMVLLMQQLQFGQTTKTEKNKKSK